MWRGRGGGGKAWKKCGQIVSPTAHGSLQRDYLGKQASRTIWSLVPAILSLRFRVEIRRDIGEISFPRGRSLSLSFFSIFLLSLSLSLSSSFTSFLLRGSRALCKTSSALRSSRARENVHRPKRYRARPYLFPSAHPRTGPMFRRSSRFLVSFPCCFCPHRDHRRSDKRSRSDFSRRLGKQVTEKHLFLIFRFLRVYRVKFSKPIP